MLRLCIFVLLSKQKLIINFRTRYFCWMSLTHQPFPLPEHGSYKLNICSGNINNFSPKLTHTEFREQRHSPPLLNPSFCQHTCLTERFCELTHLWNVLFCLLRIRLYCAERLNIKNKCELVLFLWIYNLFDNLPSTKMGLSLVNSFSQQTWGYVPPEKLNIYEAWLSSAGGILIYHKATVLPTVIFRSMFILDNCILCHRG